MGCRVSWIMDGGAKVKARLERYMAHSKERMASVCPELCLDISLGHPFPANTERFHIFSDFSQLLVQCTKMSSPWGGYVYAFRNL